MGKLLSMTAHPKFQQNAVERAYAFYCEGSKLDEDPATYDEAMVRYLQAIALNPQLAIAHTNLGNLHFRTGKPSLAVLWYNRALAIDSKQYEAQYNLGYLFMEKGQYVEAIQWFKASLENEPTFADAQFNLASAYMHSGDRIHMFVHFKAYLALEPTGPWADNARLHMSRHTEVPKKAPSKPKPERSLPRKSRYPVQLELPFTAAIANDT